MSKNRDVPRPLKRSEYAITFIAREAQKGWTDCLAMARNATVDAWDTRVRGQGCEMRRDDSSGTLHTRASEGDRMTRGRVSGGA